MKYMYIMLGGALGSLMRFWISEFISIRFQGAFPAGIFFVNTAGAMLIGFLFGLLSLNGQLDDKFRFLIFIGFLGGFTTFSSFALENMKLLKDGLIATSILYMVLTNVLGIVLAFAGYFLGAKLK